MYQSNFVIQVFTVPRNPGISGPLIFNPYWKKICISKAYVTYQQNYDFRSSVASLQASASILFNQGSKKLLEVSNFHFGGTSQTKCYLKPCK